MLASGCTIPRLSAREQEFLDGLAPAFTELEDSAADTLYFDGAARLLGEHRFEDVSQLNALMEMLERRVACSACCSQALAQNDVWVRIGRENEAPGSALAGRGGGRPTGCRGAAWARCR